MIPWEKVELVEIFESGRTTGQAAHSNPKVRDGAVNLRVRASNLQGRRREDEGRRTGERGRVSVAES